MNVEELAADLPNGFHDARLLTFSSDPGDSRAEFILEVWLGDLHSSVMSERERHRRARLELFGVTYLVVDIPDPRHAVATEAPTQVDLCAADDDPDRARQVPEGGFAGRFFVVEWNGFIHFAARDARLTWLAAN